VTRHLPVENRYDSMTYRRCGRSGLLLPALSLGLWQNFGDDRSLDAQRAILRRAFDLGITHFDLANNYGPPYGAPSPISVGSFTPTSETTAMSWSSRPKRLGHVVGPVRRSRLPQVPLGQLGSEPSPYGSRLRRHLLPPSLRPRHPLEESLGALHSAVQQGKALYIGISSYSGQRTQEAVAILSRLGTPLLIHQPSYSMLNRWIEGDLLDVLGAEGVGCIAFSALAQGLLTDRYLNGVPDGSRASRDGSLSHGMLNDENLARARALHHIAQRADSSWPRWPSPGYCVKRESPQS